MPAPGRATWELIRCESERPAVDAVRDGLSRARGTFVAFVTEGDTIVADALAQAQEVADRC